MTIRHLKIFLEVASCGSMSQTAEKLHFSQSTISQVIKELELHYHTPLFERLSKRLYITESGKKLQLYAKKIVDDFDNLQVIMNEESNTEHIRMGASVTCGSCILPNLLNEFQTLRPEVDITSCIYNTHIIEEKLLAGELDVALVEGKIKSNDLTSIPVIHDHLVLAFRSNHPFKDKTSFLPKDLAGRDFVMREEGSGTRECFEHYLATHGVTINTKVEAPFPEAMRHAILTNNCMAVTSYRLIEQQIKTNQIKALRLKGNEWNRHFSFVYHKNKYLSHSIQLLISLLENYKHTDL